MTGTTSVRRQQRRVRRLARGLHGDGAGRIKDGRPRGCGDAVHKLCEPWAHNILGWWP